MTCKVNRPLHNPSDICEVSMMDITSYYTILSYLVDTWHYCLHPDPHPYNAITLVHSGLSVHLHRSSLFAHTRSYAYKYYLIGSSLLSHSVWSLAVSTPYFYSLLLQPAFCYPCYYYGTTDFYHILYLTSFFGISFFLLSILFPTVALSPPFSLPPSLLHIPT